MTKPLNATTPAPRKSVAGLAAYVPGEQPSDPLLVKLNTNENNYPPSPRVHEALAALGDQRFSRYPDPVCRRLRESLAGQLGVTSDQVIVGNGSDEILKMFVEAYVEPGEVVAYPWPTYSLYPVFLEKYEARKHRSEWGGDVTQEAALEAIPTTGVKLAFIANPNPPIGGAWSLDALRRFALARPGTLVVFDEAYIAYGGESAMALVREGIPNVAVSRTFSKSHALAGMRVGFGVASAEVIAMLYRVKDSYNVNVASQEAARAAWEDTAYSDAVIARIIATRERVAGELRAMGFAVEKSAGNFLFARHADAQRLFAHLREQHVLVRYFAMDGLRDGFRVSIGTDEEMDVFLAAVKGGCGVPPERGINK